MGEAAHEPMYTFRHLRSVPTSATLGHDCSSFSVNDGMHLYMQTLSTGIDDWEQHLDLSLKTYEVSYEGDSLLFPFISQLQRNRKRLPQSLIWWSSYDGNNISLSDLPDLSSPRFLGSRWRSDVVRAKMSEFLCILVYREVLAMRRGQLIGSQASSDAMILQHSFQ